MQESRARENSEITTTITTTIDIKVEMKPQEQGEAKSRGGNGANFHLKYTVCEGQLLLLVYLGFDFLCNRILPRLASNAVCIIGCSSNW